MPQPRSTPNAGPPGNSPVSKDSYFGLANVVEGKDKIQRMQKKEVRSEALRNAGELYENREYVAAYECFKPVYDKITADMQRVLARNIEFEANKLAREQRKPIAAAKENVQRMRVDAQSVIDQFDRLLRDLESKALVRMHLKKRSASPLPTPPQPDEAPPTTVASASETRLEASPPAPSEIRVGNVLYRKAPYAPPEVGSTYSVRDKTKGERVIRIIEKTPDGTLLQVQILIDGIPSKQPIELPADSLARQAAKGWCSVLIAADENEAAPAATSQPSTGANPNTTMRLDIQNFSRCCADIVRANIKFDTQRIKDVGDGPFRAGDYEHAFLAFEQFTTGFNSAVGNSRRIIADGRRMLTSEKGKLSGKEIQDRTAAFTRSEHLIHTAEREFSTILEGLRMYLRASAAQQVGL